MIASPPGGTLGWVGTYQLLERLPYQGGPVEYVARQRGPLGFERTCRVKLVPMPFEGGDHRNAEAMAREARVVLRLDHPSIVRMYDFFEHDDTLVLVLEHFSALSLARLLELLEKNRTKLDERLVWHVGHNLFAALAHAHSVVEPGGNATPVVHSDVKPTNVLVSADGRVRLGGFGYGRNGESEETTACGVIGSGPTYVAPEQVQSRDVTERSDAYAAALVMWELLTGRNATPESLPDYERLQALANRQVEPLRQLRPDLPPLVTTALDACLVADPTVRTIQCEEVAGCISAAMDLRTGAQALRDAVRALGAVWEGLAAGGPNAPRSPAPSVRPRSGVGVLIDTPPGPRAADAVAPLAGTVALEDDDPAIWEEVTRIPRGTGGAQQDRALPRPAPEPVSATIPPPPYSMQVPVPSLAPVVDSPLPVPPRSSFAAIASRVVVALPIAMVSAVVTFAVVGPAGVVERGDRPAVVHAAAPQARASAPVLPPPPAASASQAPPSEPKAVPSTPPIEVPSDRAVLVVHGPPFGYVYVQGTLLGKTDEPIVTDCGGRFVRVGTEAGPQGIVSVRWLAPGQPVLLRCGTQVEVQADATAAP